MTVPKRPEGVDPFREYDEEYAVVLDRLDKMNDAFRELDTFIDRVLSYTDLDSIAFKRKRERAEEHRDKARALLSAHASFVKQAPEGSDSPVDLDDVNDHTREAKDLIGALREITEAYAEEQEDGTIWTPWVDAENQVLKVKRADEIADEAYELTWDLAPNPWPN